MARVGLPLAAWLLLSLGLAACARPAAPAAKDERQAPAAAAVSPRPPEPPMTLPPVPEPGVRAEPEAVGSLPDGSATDAVRGFYDLHMQLHASGLPVGEDLARYRPYLSRHLLARMAPAARERDRMIAEQPGLKPPYLEGDMFTGLGEGATGYRVGARTALGPGRERVELEFVYDRSEPPVRWRGRALMLREDARWKLDDVEYGDFDAGTTGEFVRSGRLADWFE